ncbi:MAG: hypothetical protein ACQET7_12625 [Thermodesulfobacteriota bacterium]
MTHVSTGGWAILSKPEGSGVPLVGFWEKLLFWRYFHHHDWMEQKLLLAAIP